MQDASGFSITPQHMPLRQSGANAQRATRRVEVVYYIQIEPGVVKIGTSRDALTRLRKYGTGAKARVLAIEWGGRDLELQRHAEFAHLRIGKAEHFRVAPDLVAHIRTLRAENVA